MIRLKMRDKLILMITGTCIFALILAGVGFGIWQWNNLRQTMIIDLSSKAEMIADNSKAALMFEDRADATEVLHSVKGQEAIVFSCLYDKNGNVFAHYAQNNSANFNVPSLYNTDSYLFRNQRLTVFKSITLDSEHIGAVCLQMDLKPMKTMLKRNLAVLTGVIIISSLISLAIASRAQKLISTPVLDLTAVARKVSRDKNFEVRASVNSSDEVGELVTAFNGMLEQIQKRDYALVIANENLENKVEERTAQLTQINDQLKTEIAERKKGEEQLRQAKIETDHINRQLRHQNENSDMMARQAILANEAKSQFLANMSHEIRTPMNAIIGFSQVLSELVSDDEQAQYIRLIGESGDHLLHLINDILDFSKVEAGQLKTEMVEFKLHQLLESVDSLLRPNATKKALDFKIIASADLPQLIKSDYVRISQCLVNIVNNAIKFTHKGHIHLTVSLDNQTDKPFIVFNVQDTGIGIPKEKQALIFEPFTQADGSTTRKYGGTGLGLTITKQLATLLGGSLELTSEPGAGSVFTMKIPAGIDLDAQNKISAVDDETLQDTEHKPLANTLFTGTVIVAEDSPTNQILIRVLLNKMGLEPVIVPNGQEAVNELAKNNYDIIFMDMQMPVMNGFEATRHLRAKGIKTPIVALTANAMKGDDTACFEAGCSEYISKPIKVASLAETLAKYLPLAEDSQNENALPSQTVRA